LIQILARLESEVEVVVVVEVVAAAAAAAEVLEGQGARSRPDRRL
jgi:hypothetical protein